MALPPRAKIAATNRNPHSKLMTILSGHTTPETAYVVNDYPYGFRLRCKIRYWLEWAGSKKGFRLWSQTTNPKKSFECWNKPKASTFCRFGGGMFLDDAGHVDWAGLTEYSSIEECVSFRDHFGATMPEEAQTFLKYWITRKLQYEQIKALQSDYTPAELAEMGRSLRETDLSKQLARLQS